MTTAQEQRRAAAPDQARSILMTIPATDAASARKLLGHEEKDGSMTFTVAQVDIWKAELAELPPPDISKRTVGKQGALILMARELHALARRGYTVREILGLLAEKGLNVHEDTLRSALRKADDKPGSRRPRRGLVDEATKKPPVTQRGATEGDVNGAQVVAVAGQGREEEGGSKTAAARNDAGIRTSEVAGDSRPAGREGPESAAGKWAEGKAVGDPEEPRTDSRKGSEAAGGQRAIPTAASFPGARRDVGWAPTGPPKGQAPGSRAAFTPRSDSEDI